MGAPTSLATRPMTGSEPVDVAIIASSYTPCRTVHQHLAREQGSLRLYSIFTDGIGKPLPREHLIGS